MAHSVDFSLQHGELAALIQAKDWSDTPLGATASWSPSLLTTLRLMLGSRYSMWLGYGPELRFFYNDAYAQQTLGPKHPWALGRPASEVWAEIWDTLNTRIAHVLRTGEATWDEGLLLFLERNGYPEETYHTFSYSPAPSDDPAQIGGLFCVVVEETERVLADRRLALLRDFAASLAQTTSEESIFAALERCLLKDAHDLPFSLTYLFDGSHSVRRVARTNFDDTHEAAGQTFALAEPTPWPFETMLHQDGPQLITLPQGGSWPKGPWAREPRHALAVPIAQQGEARPAGVFIAGLNPHRPVEDSLKGFVQLLVGQLAASLSNAGAYQAAQKRADALAEIDRAKTAFFSNVSHEFRTPLTLMLGPTEDALSSPERALTGVSLDTVYRNELRLLKLVNGLLDFARLEAGRTQASYEPTDLRALTVDLASTFRSAIERAELSLEVRCEELPEAIYVDHDMWEKIVLNLLSNALKFTLSGGISVGLHWHGDRAELSVRDTGVGVSAAELPRLFERFHRIEGSLARTHEGSGIGLALVHELVRLHGGTIDVESELGRGTTFTIAIPAGKSHLPADRLRSRHGPGPTTTAAAYVEEAMRWIPGAGNVAPTVAEHPDGLGEQLRARILVADDNADMREYIARLLSQHWEVEAVADGVEALRAVKRAQPDLVLTDVMMPRMDGFALIRELRADPRMATTPIVLLSARAGEEATAEGLRAGADDYLVKPFSASALLIRIEAQLSAARLRETLRRAEEAQRHRLETIFRESPAAICVLRGPELRVELANPLILQLWGKSAEIIGQPLIEALPEIAGQGFVELLQRVLRTGVSHLGKEALARLDSARDGVLRDSYFDFVYAPFPEPSGVVDAVFVHAYNVTEQVLARRNSDKLRDAEQHARQEAEAANRLKDEFLATMSHELRTPLNAILGWASLLRRSPEDRKNVERGLATIERNALSQARLIEDVLDVSRIISGKLRLDVRKVDITSIASAALDVVRPAAEARRVRLLVEHDPDQAVELVGDADRLQQVIWNLLSNAVKFTPSGGQVSIRVERVRSLVWLVVRDSGLGIPTEHLPFVFERFRQVDSSTTRKYGGLGLGLAIVRHLVELHGGNVWAASEGEGQGAVFTVELPIRAIHEAPPDAHVPLPIEPALDSARTMSLLLGVKILIVDDDEDSRLLLQNALERDGAWVRTADSAAAAFDFLARQRVDVIVSDIGMPDEDGISLMRRLRTAPGNANLAAIALTAYARSEDVTKALDAGYQRHLAKPADIRQLARTVAELVEKTSPRQR